MGPCFTVSFVGGVTIVDSAELAVSCLGSGGEKVIAEGELSVQEVAAVA